MNLDIRTFKEVAQKNWFNNDIVLNADRTKITSKWFHSKSTVGSASRATNVATMEAFHEALVNRYGVSGEEAFKAVLGERAAHGRSLRKNDVLKAINMAHAPAERAWNAFHNAAHGLITQMLEHNPLLKSLPDEERLKLRYVAINWLRGELHLRHNAVQAERDYAGDLDELAVEMEREIWDAIDHSPSLRRTEGLVFAKPSMSVPETGKGKGWTEGDTQALLLDMHDKATQDRMSFEFLGRVSAVRMENPEDPMVKAWDEAHENGAWKSEKAFANFARTFADRLPYGMTIAANSGIEKALKDPESALCKAVRESLPDVQTNPEKWPVESDESLEDVELNNREKQYSAELGRDRYIAERVVAKCDALLTEAKAALSICEARAETARQEMQASVKRGGGANGISDQLGNQLHALKEEAELARKTYETLEKSLPALRNEAEKAASGCRYASSSESNATRYNGEVAKLEAKLKELSETYQRDVHVDPKTEFKVEDRLTWLKHQLTIAHKDAEIAYMSAKVEHEQHMEALPGAKAFSGLIDHQVHPTKINPISKKPTAYDYSAPKDVVANRVSESFRTNVQNLETLQEDMRTLQDEVYALDKGLEELAKSSNEDTLSEEQLIENLTKAEELKKTMEEKIAERKEEFAERAKVMTPDSAMHNSPMLQGIKTRYSMLIRLALIDFAKSDGGNTAEGRVLSRFA